VSDLTAMMEARKNHYGLNIVPGHERTSYFYKREALGWLRLYRGAEWFPGAKETYLRLAKSYFETFKMLKKGGAA
jgi:hypothetical protein